MRRLANTLNCWVGENFHADHDLALLHITEIDMDLYKIERELSPTSPVVLRTISTSQMLPCGLYGPIMGDSRIPEDAVFYAPRGVRFWNSRLLAHIHVTRVTNQLSYVLGWSRERSRWELWTAFGGPIAPREPGDPSLVNDPDATAESRTFWAEHALVHHEAQ